MADIIIKGMEMPKTCCRCDLKIYDAEIRWDENGNEQIGAWVCKRTREIIWNTRRGENCPLLPLPEGHGRLIDETELIAKLVCHCKDLRKLTTKTIGETIGLCATIVPAEGGTDECSEN